LWEVAAEAANVSVTKEWPLMIIAVIALDHIVERDASRDKTKSLQKGHSPSSLIIDNILFLMIFHDLPLNQMMLEGSDIPYSLRL
jgi:hypothetical protein